MTPILAHARVYPHRRTSVGPAIRALQRRCGPGHFRPAERATAETRVLRGLSEMANERTLGRLVEASMDGRVPPTALREVFREDAVRIEERVTA